MRILGVRFKNLNSLTGEWQIDFTHPAYVSDGIFAITGPTGAGKTTILDAVCLGLYGRTPRLDRVTKSGNEIMSRQTGECFAEVTFATEKGRYRCHWSQHRARRLPEGELQQARHEIADADSGAVLESKITQVGEFIEKATGMDFERFTRSMLLAQGGFAAFLQAPPDARAPILEQITGTEIYSRISIKVHERRVEERDKLELLQAELKGIRVLSAEEERGRKAGLKEKRSREAEREGQVEGLRKAALWLVQVADLEKETATLDRQVEDCGNRLQAFAPEAGKLERSRKALGLEGDYRGVTALRAQQVTETGDLDRAVALLPNKDQACVEALAARQTAAAALDAARSRQVAAAEVIKQVRDLDARLMEQKKQVEVRVKALLAGERQSRAYKSRIEKLEQALKTSQADLDTVHDYQTRHAADAALATNLTAITRSFAALLDVEARHVKDRAALVFASVEKASALATCKKLEVDHEKSRRELERGQNELTRLSEEIVVILQEREISRWRDETAALKERERLLIQTLTTIERMDEACVALDALKAGIETLNIRQLGLSDEISSCAGRKVLQEKEMAALETHVSLMSRIRDLEDERKRLEDGKPCPLCGATDHPYAEGNIPDVNRAETELKEARVAFKKVSETFGTLEKEQAKTTADIRHAEKEWTDKNAAREADEKQCAEALAQLNIPVSENERLGKVRVEMTQVQAKITESMSIIAAVDAKRIAEKAAQNARETLREQFEHADRALQDARHKLEKAGLEQDRLTKEVATLVEEEGAARTVVLKDVAPFGVEQILSTGLDALLKDLTGRKEKWLAQEHEKTAGEITIRELKAALDKDQALLGNLEEDLAARRKERDDLMRQGESLSACRRERFGEKNADQEEKHLADAAEQAGKAMDKAREAYAQKEKELSFLKEKIALWTEKTQKRSVELVQAEHALGERIKRAGFADEADYRSACLPEDAREKLADREKSLIKEKTELEARRRDRAESLAAEQEKRLTDQPLEVLREHISAGDADLKQMRLDIGGITQSLAENEKLKERQQERSGNIETQQRECARWDDLHLLIGSADGKKFRNFAQGLTFEMMTSYANRQLKKMTDRYLLIRDTMQPLELNVIDNYQAGEIRSTKNLSGGESFIVSLALALGLSQMASRNVRVDSLFLDEGFGTLDEDGLETALETLTGLQQEGKLIGLISHVTALKERLGTQIQVIPETGGRSSLSGPGCRRL